MNEKFKKIAKQSLKEADERKKSNQQMKKKKEINGPKGLEPTRYGDWETKGITYDFQIIYLIDYQLNFAPLLDQQELKYHPNYQIDFQQLFEEFFS